MNCIKDLDESMRRAVHQESQSLVSSGLSKAKGSRRKRSTNKQNRCCLFLIMISPVVIVCSILYVLSIVNTLERDEAQKEQALLQDTKQDPSLQAQQANLEQQLLRKRQADRARLHARDAPQKLILSTQQYGDIIISLKPELSQGSVDYLHQVVDSGTCHRCNFYRAEKPGILQGVLKNTDIPTNPTKGDCPEDGVASTIPNDCPKWDSECGCHGPLMTRGAVAWAAGTAGGPDFFIDAYPKPAKWWGTQHTNFGFIEDEASLKVVDAILDLPVTVQSGLHHLKESIHFDMSLEF